MLFVSVIPKAPYPTVTDADTYTSIDCDLMNMRVAFLNYAHHKYYEFSSLRRVKFSTMVLLYQLHRIATGQLTVCCNRCGQQCRTRYHCTVCENFDLCGVCYRIRPIHEHQMKHQITLKVLNKLLQTRMIHQLPIQSYNVNK